MLRFSINRLTTRRWDLPQVIQHLSNTGISALGLWRQDLEEYGEAATIQMLHDANLRVSNLFWIGDFLGNQLFHYREAIDDAVRAIRIAKQLRCPTVVIYCGNRGNHTIKHAPRVLKNALQELLPIAQMLGVQLNLELIHPQYAHEWTLFPEIEQLVEFVTECRSPQLKITLDAYHWGLQPRALELLPQLLPHVGLVSLSDGRETPAAEESRCRLGNGHVPLAELFAALHTHQYTGYFDLKLYGPEIERENTLELIQHASAYYRRHLQQIPTTV
jgi:sugar phosphate isomerase/epimerase